VRQAETALAELIARGLAGEEKVLMVDGEYMAERCVVVAWPSPQTERRNRSGLRDAPTYM
jgi:antitoxin (DNA-binding transcriptional repressor) of toxin-antitoxin stability system